MRYAMQQRGGRLCSVLVTLLVSAGVLIGVGQGAAYADVTAVSGSAFGYYTSAAFDFGSGPGPADVHGPAPEVTLPPTGGSETASIESAQVYTGPALFFESGPITVHTEGTTGPSGSSTSSVSVIQDKAGVDPFYFSTVDSSCTSSEEGTTASTTFTGAALNLGNGDGVSLPDNPLPNTEYFGTIDGVNDRFRIVLNEQVVTSDSITVNAMHMYMIGPIAHGEVIVGQSHCDVVATSPNDAPLVTDDTFDTGGSPTLDVPAPGVLGNDTDPEGGALIAYVQSEPAKGALVLNLDGSFTYTPDVTFDGSDTFSYIGVDPRGANTAATVTITGPSLVPPNDNFADAEVITGSSGSVTGNNVNATQEAGDFAMFSIWYVWTAPEDGVYAFDTCGTSFPAMLLGAVTGESLSSAVEVPQQNIYGTYPAPECAGPRARYLIRAVGGTVYHVVVGGYGGPSEGMGDVVLSWQPLPRAANDDFADAQAISGPSGSVTGSNGPGSVASYEPGELTAHWEPALSIWYRWTAPADGEVTFETCDSDFNTLLSVHTGESVDALTEVARNYNGCESGGGSRVVFEATAGTVYHISVDGLLQAFGTVVLEWTQIIPNESPVARNDAYSATSARALTVNAPGVLSNDTDADGDALSAGSPSEPDHGSVILNPDGSFTYTSDAGFTGTDTFTYTADDGEGGTATATVTITVTNPVVGPPTNVNACKNNGWKAFNNPVFKNQGQCVSYVKAKTNPR